MSKNITSRIPSYVEDIECLHPDNTYVTLPDTVFPRYSPEQTFGSHPAHLMVKSLGCGVNCVRSLVRVPRCGANEACHTLENGTAASFVCPPIYYCYVWNECHKMPEDAARRCRNSKSKLEVRHLFYAFPHFGRLYPLPRTVLETKKIIYVPDDIFDACRHRLV